VETIEFDMVLAGVPWFSVKFVGLTDIYERPFKWRLGGGLRPIADGDKITKNLQQQVLLKLYP
jgi:hypothetical protein